MFGKSLLKTVAVSSMGVLAVSQAAQAALNIDLRFGSTSQPAGSVITGDGNISTIYPTGVPKTITIPANTLSVVRIQVWAVVTGQAGNSLNEGLVNVISAFKSSNAAGGIAGGISTGSRATGWTNQSGFNGASSNITTDGIGDWGNVADTPTTIDTSMGYFRPRTTIVGAQADFGNTNPGDDPDNPVPTTPCAASQIHYLADGGIEFLIGNLQFLPTAAPGGSQVVYSPVLPAGGQNGQGWAEDSNQDLSSPTGLKSNATGTTGPFTPNGTNIGGLTIQYVPEPTSIGLLGLGALGVLRRRRS